MLESKFIEIPEAGKFIEVPGVGIVAIDFPRKTPRTIIAAEKSGIEQDLKEIGEGKIIYLKDMQNLEQLLKNLESRMLTVKEYLTALEYSEKFCPELYKSMASGNLPLTEVARKGDNTYCFFAGRDGKEPVEIDYVFPELFPIAREVKDIFERFVYVPDCRIYVAVDLLRCDRRVIEAARKADVDISDYIAHQNQPLCVDPGDVEKLLKELGSRMLTLEQYPIVLDFARNHNPQLYASLMQPRLVTRYTDCIGEMVQEGPIFRYYSEGKLQGRAYKPDEPIEESNVLEAIMNSMTVGVREVKDSIEKLIK